ncbi:hypothetical protein [Aureivirga marina]|uniref:hypothetical protein n=1 Tax=Aureivirga marina TaxID=1182451 RepID=UPI001E64EA92|nr:hypothetical protein [Aureivirga marina]
MIKIIVYLKYLTVLWKSIINGKMDRKEAHNFYIPVMGLAYTIDSPIKVAHYGISSVMSIVDDILVEQMNEHYAKKYSLPFQKYSSKDIYARANRIKDYLNNVQKIVETKFEDFKQEISTNTKSLNDYIETLPKFSNIKNKLVEFADENLNSDTIKSWLDEHLSHGSIDVNIMTKVDKANFDGKEPLPSEFNDGHLSLKGFAESDLNSSLVLSAGMNPRLYSYIEKFEDFYPDANGNIKKKIILKVSDYRSAMIQGKFLAKKGIWVSEYRIESGLNCGGHAFATEGLLLGPILQEFKEGKEALAKETQDIAFSALEKKGKTVPKNLPNVKITAQGGVGTGEEHQFLLENYDLDAIGWGSPFLLVPEATTVDDDTIAKLSEAKEKDLYLSKVSPLGVPFNNLRTSSNEVLKREKLEINKYGSSCPKKFLVSNKNYSDRPICTASRKYIEKEMESLNDEILTPEEKQNRIAEINVKSCLCIGLASAALEKNNISVKGEKQGIVICPGPNMAYFNETFKLKDMIRHIYGYENVKVATNRPHVFVKELGIYLDYLKNELEEVKTEFTKKQEKYFNSFQSNLEKAVSYYEDLNAQVQLFSENSMKSAMKTLEEIKFSLEEKLCVS